MSLLTDEEMRGLKTPTGYFAVGYGFEEGAKIVAQAQDELTRKEIVERVEKAGLADEEIKGVIAHYWEEDVVVVTELDRDIAKAQSQKILEALKGS